MCGQRHDISRTAISVMVLMLGGAIAGCAKHATVNPVDINLNPWLGKSKEERMRMVGAPTQCITLNTGEEICDWVRRGPYDFNIDCPPDGIYGGHRCQRTAGREKHHLIFRYDRQGIAHAWSYRGSGGTRRSDVVDQGTLVPQQVKVSTD